MKKSKENILITRDLSDESPLRNLSNNARNIIAQSFIKIEALDISEIPTSEVYFYYSKNAVLHFMKAALKLKIDVKKYKHAAMGEGTSSTLASYGVKADFVGKGMPQSIAQVLIKEYHQKSICFVRAEQSTQSIQKLWPSNYNEIVAYRIIPNDINIQENIHTIFATSPMNLKISMERCNIQDLQYVVCIGSTTYKVAKEITEAEVILSESSTEEAMLQAYLHHR